MAAAVQPGPVFGGEKTPESEGEPGMAGIQLFRDWLAGKLAKMQLPFDWAMVLPPQGVAYFAPKDWTMIPVSDPDILDFSDGNPAGSWIVSPDQLSGVLMVNITSLVRGEVVEAAWRDLRAFYPDSPIEQVTEDSYPPQYNVSRGLISARIGEKTVVVVASSLPDSLTGGMFLYYNLAIADTADFDELTKTVFLPLLMNLVPAGGSSVMPTPTPMR
jgi:hypothetical protein